MAQHRVKRANTLIAALLDMDPEMKRSTAKDRIRSGAVTVNDEVTRVATTPLEPGDVVGLSSKGGSSNPRKSARAPSVDILHVDAEIVVVSKPTGLLTVRGGTGGGDTLLKLVAAQMTGNQRLFPCHRLDRETSGLLVLPRTKDVQHWFFENWSQVEKHYAAVVEGQLAEDELRIDLSLWEDELTKAVYVSERPGSRAAITEVRVLKRGRDATLVEARLETGRKHQIRVHLAHLGHPILGDARYGDREAAPRLCLHAARLSFPHPSSGDVKTFELPPPKLFADLVRGARAK